MKTKILNILLILGIVIIIIGSLSPKKAIGANDPAPIITGLLENLSYKTKAQILEMRKQAISRSLIADKNNYVPSEYLFGGIQDGKPWIKNYVCRENGKGAFVDGDSKYSRFLLNPDLIVYIDYPYYVPYDESEHDYCLYFTQKFQPFDGLYSKLNKELTLKYRRLPKISSYSNFIFNGLNAVDLNYSYAYLDTQKSTMKIECLDETNVCNSVAQFKDVIHTGDSCQVEGGCNNWSPMAAEFRFKVPEEERTRIGQKELYMKLWRKKPLFKEQKADLTVKFVIE